MEFGEACRRILAGIEAVEEGTALDEATKAADRQEFARRRPDGRLFS